MNYVISLIIPVYNSEKYLDNCLKSIINQTYSNLEIICINDGSTDSSQKILESYQKIDKRIVIVNKKNEGVSSARNEGLKRSTGEYILFADSDDILENEYIEECLNGIKKYHADIVKTNFCINNRENVSPINENNRVITKDIFFQNVVKNNFFNPVWGTLIDANIIRNNKLCFNQNVVYGEDLLFNIALYSYSKKSIYLNISGYKYIDNFDGITRSASIKSIKKKIADSYFVYESLKKYDIEDNLIDIMIINKIDINLKNYISTNKVTLKDYKKLVNEIFNETDRFTNVKLRNTNFSLKKKIKIWLLCNKFFSIYYFLIKK